MLAKPMRIKERKKKTPDKMMEHFLPAQLREREDRLLPSMAPMGGRDTTNGGKLKTYSTSVQSHLSRSKCQDPVEQ